MPALVPTPEELRMEEKKQEIAKSSGLGAVVDRMTEKRRRLLIAMVTFPDKSDRELLQLAGVRGIKKEDVFREVGGKLAHVLKRFGITQADIARNIHQCLNATKTVKTRRAVKDEDGNTTFVNEVEHVPDFQVRLKVIEMLNRLGDYYPASKLKGEVAHTHGLASQTHALLENREREQLESTYEEVENPVN